MFTALKCLPLKESKNMNKFETPQEQLKNTAEETEKLKQELELLLNNPEENKEEISTLTNELKALSMILEKEVEKIEETLSFLRENPKEIETETRFFILKALSQDEDDNVRAYIALNPNTPPEILEKLSNDNALNIRIPALNRIKNMKRAI